MFDRVAHYFLIPSAMKAFLGEPSQRSCQNFVKTLVMAGLPRPWIETFEEGFNRSRALSVARNFLAGLSPEQVGALFNALGPDQCDELIELMRLLVDSSLASVPAAPAPASPLH